MTPTPTITLTPTPTPTSTPTPTPTSTPTPTLTPTPIPTPTPTPTPTPPPVRKVVVIPGLGGSWNADAMLHCKADNYQGSWTSWAPADRIYQPLLDNLTSVGFTVKPFYYDWRKQIPETIPLLSDFISKSVPANEKVDVVGHSMGGLIGAGFVKNLPLNNVVEKLMTVGAPHQGTLIAYPVWSAGEISGNILWKMATTIALRSCSIKGSNKEKIQQIAPSIQNLLPTFSYLKDNKTGKIIDLGSMKTKNNWLPVTPFATNTTIGTLIGYGIDTLEFFRVNKNASSKNGGWVDGKPVKNEYIYDGDGTVLKTSSWWEGAQNIIINQDHTGLVTSQQGIGKILNFLSTAGGAMSAKLEAPAAPPTSSLLVIGDPAYFWVLDPKQQLVEGVDGMATIINPVKGIYRLILVPKTPITRVVVAQFLENGDTLWKEYTHKGLVPKVKTIKYFPDNPLEDALQ